MKLRTEPIAQGVKCKAYRNLNLKKQGIVGWSVAVGGIVKQHPVAVVVSNATMKHATEAQAQKVKDTVRAVCAWINGEFTWSMMGPSEHVPQDGQGWRRLHCCPKKSDGKFHDMVTGDVVDQAEKVWLDSTGKAWYLPKEN